MFFSSALPPPAYPCARRVALYRNRGHRRDDRTPVSPPPRDVLRVLLRAYGDSKGNDCLGGAFTLFAPRHANDPVTAVTASDDPGPRAEVTTTPLCLVAYGWRIRIGSADFDPSICLLIFIEREILKPQLVHGCHNTGCF